MKRTIILWTAYLSLFFLFGCKIGDDDQPSRDVFQFREEVAISPVKKEYSKGDIFFLEVNVPEKVFQDLATGESVTVGNAIFSFNTRIETLQVDPLPPDTARFDLILQNGKAEEDEDFSSTGAVQVSYGCPESDYSLLFGFQLKEAGNYLIVLNDLNALSLILFTADSDCSIHNTLPPPDDADQAFIRYIFDEEDVNLDVFEEVLGMGVDPNAQYYRELLAGKLAFFLKVR